jgi:TPR repeat protein
MERGDSAVTLDLPDPARQQIGAVYTAAAFELLKQLSGVPDGQVYPPACAVLGMVYEGRGRKESPEYFRNAIYLYERGAKLGDHDCHERWIDMLEKGRTGMPSDRALADHIR